MDKLNVVEVFIGAAKVGRIALTEQRLCAFEYDAEFLKNTDFVLAADCTAFAYGNFHQQFLKNKSMAIACPKLDNAPDLYVEKLTAMIDNSSINTLTVVIVEVPCCRGVLQIAQQAQANAKRKIPIKKIVVGIKGNLQSEEWI